MNQIIHQSPNIEHSTVCGRVLSTKCFLSTAYDVYPPISEHSTIYRKLRRYLILIAVPFFLSLIYYKYFYKNKYWSNFSYH
jgi:hypothetical protein